MAELNKHLEHLEDRCFRDPAHAVDSLIASTDPSAQLSTKYDGSPAIVFGRDPESGEFFVGTKSVFNKTVPKINRSYDEIGFNYESDPGLTQKLIACLKYLPEITPNEGVFMGDLLYSDGDVKDDGKRYSFTPNTITYLVDRASPEGLKVGSSRLGIVVHTRYIGDSLRDMNSVHIDDYAIFPSSTNVYLVDPTIEHDGIDSRQVQRTIDRVNDEVKLINKKLKVRSHYDRLVRYINNCVRFGKDPTPKEYTEFLQKTLESHLTKLKTVIGRNNAIQSEQPFIDDSVQYADSFKALFRVHKYVADAKKSIIKELQPTVSFEHEYRGRPTGPEGFVVRTDDHGAFKLIDRDEFSRLNFDVHDLRKAGKEKLRNPETIVVAWGRFNPPTAGHASLIGKVLETARRASGDHIIVMSRTVDGKKNPLDPLAKEKYVKSFFPGVKAKLVNAEQPTVISLLAELSKKYKDLILIVGDDRQADMKRIINTYNGKDFQFNSAQIVSAGPRDPESDGIEGISAEKMREAARNDDYETFASLAPRTAKDEVIQNMFVDVQLGLAMGPPASGPGTTKAKQIEREASQGGPPQHKPLSADEKTPGKYDFKTRRNNKRIADIGPVINSTTSGSALGRYKNREDAIGAKAKAELQRREIARDSRIKLPNN